MSAGAGPLPAPPADIPRFARNDSRADVAQVGVDAIEIRPARPADLPAVEQLLAESFGQSPDSAFAGAPPERQLRLRLALRRLEPHPTDGLIVAADGPSIVGVVSLATAESATRPGLAALAVLRPLGLLGLVRFYLTAHVRDHRPGADEAYVHGLAVAPSHRRRGLGERLLEAAEAEALRRGKPLLSAFVAPTNRASLALFARQGFRPRPAGRRLGLIPGRGAVLLRSELR